MINDKVFLGYPVKFKDICQVYPPTVNDVVGNDDFNAYQALFTMTQEELNDAYNEQVKSQGFQVPQAPIEGQPIQQKQLPIPTPFQYLLMNYHQDEEMRRKIEDGFKLLLHEPVTIVPEIEMLLIGKSEDELDPDKDLDNPRLLTNDNFFDFQNVIRSVLGEKAIEPIDPDEDPRVQRIKAKGRQRDRIAAKKQRGPTFGTLLAAICCMGIGLSPLNIGEVSYASVQWLVGIYQQKEEYSLDIRSLLAGADSKKVKPKYWIKNLD